MLGNVQVPTDGLVLKGWYNTVTVAVYGCLTTIKPVKASPPPPPPPIQRKAAGSNTAILQTAVVVTTLHLMTAVVTQ